MNNPAGRLHAVLTKYEETRAANHTTSLEAVWSRTLGVSGVQLRVALARIAGLVPQIAEIARNFETEHDDPSTLASVNAHAPAWLKPVILPELAARQAVNSEHAVVGQDAMLALGSLSFTISRLSPEGNDLSDEVRGDLHAQVEQLMGAVRADTALPAELKDLILQRLHDIEVALDTYEFGGPGGIEAACDRLVATLVRNAEHAQNSAIQNIWKTIVGIYVTLGVLVTLSEAGQIAMTAYTQISGHN